jgi:ABC-type glycerol-3-phosphate transport system substrate-binding protein
MVRLMCAMTIGCLALCAGCAGAPSSSSGSGGSITMYGTIDQGVTVRN